MTRPEPHRIAIACGGTGGHLFPGIAVGDCLKRAGCEVTLLVSTKAADRRASALARNMEIIELPAVGLARGAGIAFVRGFFASWRRASKLFAEAPPDAVLGMGGFTSAPPILAGKRRGARVFIHESNTIPGRANRWLARVADRIFVGFPSAASRFGRRDAFVTGTPVRPQFQRRDPAACRAALGLYPARPVFLVMGGSQGASAINTLVANSLPLLARLCPDWQWLHLTGEADAERVEGAYEALNLPAQVHPFLAAMDLALGAASVGISRAGASSLAEIAATGTPAVLIPYPAATDQHQLHNARAFAETGAARLFEETAATPAALVQTLRDLAESGSVREKMRQALAQWHTPNAAQSIAEAILSSIAAAGVAVDRGVGGGKPAQPLKSKLSNESFLNVPDRIKAH